jgi:hypothetical protein
MVSTRLRRNKVRTRGQQVAPKCAGFLALALLLAGCHPDGGSPRGAAVRFLYAH